MRFCPLTSHDLTWRKPKELSCHLIRHDCSGRRSPVNLAIAICLLHFLAHQLRFAAAGLSWACQRWRGHGGLSQLWPNSRGGLCEKEHVWNLGLRFQRYESNIVKLQCEWNKRQNSDLSESLKTLICSVLPFSHNGNQPHPTFKWTAFKC